MTPGERAGHVLELVIPVYKAGDDPKLEFQLAAAITAAIVEERERCAKVLDDAAAHAVSHLQEVGGGHGCEDARDLARAWAAQIRRGPQPVEQPQCSPRSASKASG